MFVCEHLNFRPNEEIRKKINFQGGKMTFTQYLKAKKGIDPDSKEMSDLMDEYYDDYMEYLSKLKDGCGPDSS